MTYSQAFRMAALLVITYSPLRAYSEVTGEHGLLSVSPNRCIALRQGQYCYQKLKFSWQVREPHEYCLYANLDEAPLVCWQGAKLTGYVHEFKSLQDQAFTLRNETLGVLMDEVVIDVAWVYKSSKKVSTGWRLF